MMKEKIKQQENSKPKSENRKKSKQLSCERSTDYNAIKKGGDFFSPIAATGASTKHNEQAYMI